MFVSVNVVILLRGNFPKAKLEAPENQQHTKTGRSEDSGNGDDSGDGGDGGDSEDDGGDGDGGGDGGMGARREEGLGCVAQPSVRYNELNINKLSYYPCRNSGRDKVLNRSISASSGPRVLRPQKDKLPIQETSRQHICHDARFLLLAKYQHFTRLHVVNFNHV